MKRLLQFVVPLPAFATAAVLASSCAGELTPQEVAVFLSADGSPTGGPTGTGAGAGPGTGTGGAGPGTGGTGPGTGGTGVGGAGGTGPVNIDMCAVPILKDRCGIPGCHGDLNPSAGLALTEAVAARPFALADKPNSGDGTPSGCQPGAAKVVDTQAPERSLMYTKVTIPTCGGKMPVGAPLSPADIACILSWIKSIPPGGGGTGGAGGAGGTGSGGTGGAAGSGGSGGARDGGRG